MQNVEYTVIPAPARGEKSRAAKTPADRYAHALTQALNIMAAQGWEYVRAETLPSEERTGLTGRATVWINVLVFRRALAPVGVAEAAAPLALAQHAPPAVRAPAAELRGTGEPAGMTHPAVGEPERTPTA